jgi:hypothetical protein
MEVRWSWSGGTSVRRPPRLPLCLLPRVLPLRLIRPLDRPLDRPLPRLLFRPPLHLLPRPPLPCVLLHLLPHLLLRLPLCRLFRLPLCPPLCQLLCLLFFASSPLSLFLSFSSFFASASSCFSCFFRKSPFDGVTKGASFHLSGFLLPFLAEGMSASRRTTSLRCNKTNSPLRVEPGSLLQP